MKPKSSKRKSGRSPLFSLRLKPDSKAFLKLAADYKRSKLATYIVDSAFAKAERDLDERFDPLNAEEQLRRIKSKMSQPQSPR